MTFAADGTLLETEDLPTTTPGPLTSAAIAATPDDMTGTETDADDGDESSVAAPVVETSSFTTSGVEVVDIEPAEDDEADGDVDVAPSKLPRAVSRAFEARFPGARVIEAESGFEDGEREFDVTARWRGQVVDVTLTPGGEIIETEQALTAGELPAAVQDWLRAAFAGAAVEDASVSVEDASVAVEDGVLSYEVLIAPPDGGQAVEATLHVPGAQPPAILTAAGGGDVDGSESQERLPGPKHLAGGSTSPRAFADGEAPGGDVGIEPQTAGATVGPSADAAPARPADGADNAAIARARPKSGAEADAGIPAGVLAGAAAAAAQVAGVVEAAAARATDAAAATAWLPQLAGALNDVLPLELAAADRAVEEILGRIEALTAELMGTDAAGRADGVATAARLARLAALVAAAHLLRLGSRRRRAAGGPLLVFNGAAGSWSWVLGSTSTRATPPPTSTVAMKQSRIGHEDGSRL